MKKIILSVITAVSLLCASEGLPVLLFPDNAYLGSMPRVHFADEKAVDFTYASWFYDTDYSSINARIGRMGYGFKGLISGNIDIRGEQPTDVPLGNMQYNNSSLYVQRRWDLTKNMLFDTRLKLLYEGLFYVSSWGAAADLRLIYSNHVNYSLFGGISNLGLMSDLGDEPTELPTRIYAGGTFIFNFFEFSAVAGTDLDRSPYWQGGIRYVHPIFDICYSWDSLKKLHHVGADLKWKRFLVGYGFYMHKDGLGNMSMVSLGINL